MKQLQPVIWSKGTFLSPQHLQAQDRFFEDTLWFHLQALKFRAYGFRELKINQAGLAEGEFGLSAASGIFPDGLLFEFPGSDAGPASKSVVDIFEPDQKTLDVFLAVPDYRHRGINVSLLQQGNMTRYRAENELVRDENTGASEKTIQVARKNLRLLAENESREGSCAMRVARVERTGTGVYRLDPAFVPPLLDLAASEYLTGMLRGVIEILAARSSTLSATRRQKNQTLADFSAADIASFWLLYTINAHFPAFTHLFETKKGHPEEMYSAMLALAGALTAFSTKIHPRDLPDYDHDDLGACFSALELKLRLLLETVVPTSVVSLPLKLVQPSIYATALDDEKYLHNTQMYLAVNADASEAELIQRVPQLVKVCSATHIETLVRQALPGMPLLHAPVPPSAIPVKLKYQYFSLSQSGVGWESVTRARNFAAYVPSDFPNPQLELIILLPKEG